MSCGIDEYKRIKAIDDVFKLGYKFTVRELSIHLKLKNLHDPANAFSCGVSEKVLYKVLTAMKNELHVPLTKNLQNQYYYYYLCHRYRYFYITLLLNTLL